MEFEELEVPQLPSFKVVDNMNLKTALRGLEKAMIFSALRQAQGNQSMASRILGISRTNLITKIKAYALEIGK